jgi:hypothetical protein
MYADLFREYTNSTNKEGTKILEVYCLEINTHTYFKQPVLNLNPQKKQTVETVIIRLVFIHVPMHRVPSKLVSSKPYSYTRKSQE